MQAKEGFGLTKLFIGIPIISLGIFNLLDQIDKNQNLIERSYLTFIFIILGILVLFLSKKISLSILFLFIAIYTLLDPSNISDYSASIFFIYAFHLIQKKWYAISISAVTMLSLAYRATNHSLTIYQSFGMLIGFMVVYAVYYFLIYKNYPKPITARIKQLSEDENKLLRLMCSGCSQENAGIEIGHKDKHITSKAMKDIREKLDISKEESNYKVIAIFLKYGK
jgi:hypothetical protein